MFFFSCWMDGWILKFIFSILFHVKQSNRATDADVGPNAVLRYSLIGGNTQGHFVIDSLSGDVAVVQPLDFETVRSYRLVIRAQDGGNPSRSNTTQLLVNVRDVNDNAPRFYTSLFQESVIENVPVGHSIVRVQAYDADDADNALISYRIVPLATMTPTGNQQMDEDQLPFGIDPDTGWIVTVRDLDREENHHHEFEVRSHRFQSSFYDDDFSRNFGFSFPNLWNRSKSF
jgi:cadherin EGF LAG seven-pass G-type receptor 1